MTPLTLIGFGGMVMAAGVVLAVVALRPAPPQLSAALAQLAAAPTLPSGAAVPVTAGWRRWPGLPAGVARLVESRVGVSDADLAILEMTRPQLAARKVARAGAGLLLPAVITALLALAGGGLSAGLPAGVAVVLAGVGWAGPSIAVRGEAARARAQFRAALRTFLTLVAQERAARGSPNEALEEAARPWRSWSFTRIHTEVLRAELAGEHPWDALRRLGTRLGVDELRALADIVSTAADGAAVFDTLLAESRNLHHADLAAQQADANVTERQVMVPLAMLGIGVVLLILVPPLLRMFAI